MISSKATTTILLLGTPPDDQISIFLLMYFQLCVCVCVCVCVFVCVCLCVCVLFILGCFHFLQRKKIQEQEIHGGKLLTEASI